MARKRLSENQKLKILRGIAQDRSNGTTVERASQNAGISVATYYGWRKRFSSTARSSRYAEYSLTQENQIRLISLYEENIRLRGIERQLLITVTQLLLKKLNPNQLLPSIKPGHRKNFIDYVEPALFGPSKNKNERALIVTLYLIGASVASITEVLSVSGRHVRNCIKHVRDGEIATLLESHKRRPKWQEPVYKEKLFAVLHAPPSDYGINRTTWTIDLLVEVLAAEGYPIGKNYISKMIRAEGFVFRKTREVLTSNDPDYQEKLEKITRTLRRLGPLDRFFSIDEYGPVSIRERGGRRRVRRGEKPTIPQYQHPKGKLIITAALELSRNQISHFYSEKKDTDEMIKLLHMLLEEYWDCRRLYLSWDAASWHSSQKFLAEIRRVNSRSFRQKHQSPTVKLTPLPARAQFLNVIESVFSGLSQSVIHNSNYSTVKDAKLAIDRYIKERNSYFRKNPRKAGNTIWGEEQTPSYFSVSHNCKDPARVKLAARR